MADASDRTIYNEGRVVGLSAYEIYVRHHLETEGDSVPAASEVEWLASSIAMGTSMILKVPVTDTFVSRDSVNDYKIIDIYFPQASMLTAANTIVASFFDGECVWDSTDTWAIRVSSYGDGISNNSTASPNGDVGPQDSIVPVGGNNPVLKWSTDRINRLRSYMQIVDGIVIQPGTWSNSSATPPTKDFIPDFTGYPRLRLVIKGNISSAVRPAILLTGFTLRSVISGVTGTSGSTDTPHPENGDFAGPACYPWANKVVFSVPDSYINFFEIYDYKRTIGSGNSADTAEVVNTSKIDIQNVNPHTYYTSYYPGSCIPMTVSNVIPKQSGISVLTVYQKKAVYPPALYASVVSALGDNYLNPLDVVAPGCVKIFDTRTGSPYEGMTDAQLQALLIDYESTFPGTVACVRDDGTIKTLNNANQLVAMGGQMTPTSLVYTSQGNAYQCGSTNTVSVSDIPARAAIVQLGGGQALLLKFDDANNTQLTLTPQPTTALIPDATANPISVSAAVRTTYQNRRYYQAHAESDVSWTRLLQMLIGDRGEDIIGPQLRGFREMLPDLVTGRNGGLYVDGVSRLGGEVKTFRNYIDFNGTRLYISSTQPTGTIPEGSIGIGWGM